MTRILVLGAEGMLGGAILNYLSSRNSYVVVGTARTKKKDKRPLRSFLRTDTEVIYDVDASNVEHFIKVSKVFKPDVIINCIGIRQNPRSPSESSKLIEANSLWPHRLAEIGACLKARIIHFSTDAVFSGLRGQYREDDSPDPIDSYGRSKLLGELSHSNCLTLRTSIIGRSDSNSGQLLDWLTRQKSPVDGYEKSIFSGLTTLEIARILETKVLDRADLSGVWHVASSPISKFELLRLVSERFHLGITINPIQGPARDLSLDASMFNSVTGYTAPNWDELINDFYEFEYFTG